MVDEPTEQQRPPKIIRILPGGIPLREPWPSELQFFLSRPEVTGLAADDDCVVVNPYCKLSDVELQAVAANESARVFMRKNEFYPTFALTPAQEFAFSNYGPLDFVKQTIAARILTSDPSALDPTEEQVYFVHELRKRMRL